MPTEEHVVGASDETFLKRTILKCRSERVSASAFFAPIVFWSMKAAPFLNNESPPHGPHRLLAHIAVEVTQGQGSPAETEEGKTRGKYELCIDCFSACCSFKYFGHREIPRFLRLNLSSPLHSRAAASHCDHRTVFSIESGRQPLVSCTEHS